MICDISASDGRNPNPMNIWIDYADKYTEAIGTLSGLNLTHDHWHITSVQQENSGKYSIKDSILIANKEMNLIIYYNCNCLPEANIGFNTLWEVGSDAMASLNYSTANKKFTLNLYEYMYNSDAGSLTDMIYDYLLGTYYFYHEGAWQSLNKDNLKQAVYIALQYALTSTKGE